MIKCIVLIFLIKLSYSEYSDYNSMEESEESEESDEMEETGETKTTTEQPTLDPWATTTVMPKFYFDGVDYDSLPDNFRQEHYDCYGYYNRCILSVTYFQAVCALGNSTRWDAWRGHYYLNWWPLPDFVTRCSIELRACLGRQEYNFEIYGSDWAQYDGARPPAWSFQGEGKYCNEDT